MWIQSHYDTIFSAISHTVITDRLIFRRCGAQVVSPSGIHCNYLCQRSGWGCVVGPVCLCVCVSVTRITPNVISQFDWNLILWLDLPVGRVDWLLVVIRSRGGFLITLSLSSAFSCRMGQFRRFISISHAATGRFSQNSAKCLIQPYCCHMLNKDLEIWRFGDWREMIDVDRRMNPIHFGSDPADTQILINPESRIWFPDHLWLGLHALAEVCCLWVLST